MFSYNQISMKGYFGGFERPFAQIAEAEQEGQMHWRFADWARDFHGGHGVSYDFFFNRFEGLLRWWQGKCGHQIDHA